MFGAFLTGSRAYGLHHDNSDADLVVLVDPATLNVLRAVADSDDGDKIKKNSDAGPTSGCGESASLRFGKLNLLCTTDPVAYAVWLKGTRMLKNAGVGGVSRKLAVEFFDQLRRTHGLYSETPQVKDVKEYLNQLPEEDDPPFEIGQGVEYDHPTDGVMGGLITEILPDGRAVVSVHGVDRRINTSRLRKVSGLPGYRARRTELDDL